jgi:hypothetical protein
MATGVKALDWGCSGALPEVQRGLHWEHFFRAVSSDCSELNLQISTCAFGLAPEGMVTRVASIHLWKGSGEPTWAATVPLFQWRHLTTEPHLGLGFKVSAHASSWLLTFLTSGHNVKTLRPSARNDLSSRSSHIWARNDTAG